MKMQSAPKPRTRRARRAQKRRMQAVRPARRYRARLKEQREREGEAKRPAKDPRWAAPVDPVWGPAPIPATPTPHVPQPAAHEPVAPPEPEEPVVPKEIPYVRHAARVKAPKPPKALGDAVDPDSGRRRVRIPMSDGRVVEGETRGGGGDAMPSATEILDWEN